VKKLALVLLCGSLFSSGAFASAHCSYELDNESYEENASGVLNFNGKVYNCKSVLVGGDLLTLCKDPKRAPVQPEVFEYSVYFDGAEADFFVNASPFDKNYICHGIADAKKKIF
jgi:hypothetical protein